jgi:predicted membrane GTPase involved in stress response
VDNSLDGQGGWLSFQDFLSMASLVSLEQHLIGMIPTADARTTEPIKRKVVTLENMDIVGYLQVTRVCRQEIYTTFKSKL